jgi:hypothetical protein
MTFVDNLNAIVHFIPWQDAVAMVNNFQTEKQRILSGESSIGPNTLLDYETFNVPAVLAIMEQPGCVGFRIYSGMNDNNEICCILVGVDVNGQDVIVTNGNCALLLCDEEGQRYP